MRYTYGVWISWKSHTIRNSNLLNGRHPFWKKIEVQHPTGLVDTVLVETTVLVEEKPLTFY